MRSLALDVRFDSEAIAAIPQTGPVVVVANHPYGVLDGIVISWLVSKVRSDFVVLTNAVLMRAPEVKASFCRSTSARPKRRSRPTSPRAPRRARSSKRAAWWWCFRRRRLDRPRQARPQACGGRALAAFRFPAHSALEGGGRAGLVRRTEQPAVPDRQPRQPDPAHLADFPRGQIADRDVAPGGRSARRSRSRPSPRSRTARRSPTTCAPAFTRSPGSRPPVRCAGAAEKVLRPAVRAALKAAEGGLGSAERDDESVTPLAGHRSDIPGFHIRRGR